MRQSFFCQNVLFTELSESICTNPFFTTIANQCQEICDANGWDVIIADGNGDAGKQITDMEDMVTQGADIILCSSYDPQIRWVRLLSKLPSSPVKQVTATAP